MPKFLNKFKRPCFWSIFGPFFGKTIFFRKSVSVTTTSCGLLAPCQNLEKAYTVPIKCPDRRKDGQTRFHRTLPAAAGSPKRAANL